MSSSATASRCSPSGHGLPPQLPLMRVVTPWRTELSAPGMLRMPPSAWLDAWLWTSMNPGATIRPAASMTSRASAAARSPIAWMRSPDMPTSATNGSAPVPSATVPPLMSRSKVMGGSVLSVVEGKGGEWHQSTAQRPAGLTPSLKLRCPEKDPPSTRQRRRRRQRDELIVGAGSPTYD